VSDHRSLLQALTFGQPVAEEERDGLEQYFVHTSYWQELVAGDIDITYGVKGSGKSALYMALLTATEVRDRGTLVVAGERPKGTPAFGDLGKGDSLSEPEFEDLWRLYFLALIADVLREQNAQGASARSIIAKVEAAGLIPYNRNLPGLLRHVRALVGRVRGVETGLGLDPATGAPTSMTAKLAVEDTPSLLIPAGESLQAMLETADHALVENALSVWIALDRLDVAFSGAPILERNCLRALLRVYLDCRNLEASDIKIFLRRDVMARLMQGGFAEASHLIRTATIGWEPPSTLVNLIATRVLSRPEIATALDVDPTTVLADYGAQEDVLGRVLGTIDGVRGIDWVLGHCINGSRTAMPREVIQLLDAARRHEIQRLDLGHAGHPSGALLSPESLLEGLKHVSTARLVQTIYAENPKLQAYIQRLDSQATELTGRQLGLLWKTDEEETDALTTGIVDVGVFQRMPMIDGEDRFLIPPLYRPALNIREGRT
jgi:hypothetical protein